MYTPCIVNSTLYFDFKKAVEKKRRKIKKKKKAAKHLQFTIKILYM